jgi:hypothetical protein
MKKNIQILISMSTLVLALAISSLAQCEAKKITLTNGTATLSGKTGGCNKFKFSVATGKRVRVTLNSADSKARFDLYWDAEEDETGTELFENQTSINEVLEYPNWLINIAGTSGATYTLKITVTDD